MTPVYQAGEKVVSRFVARGSVNDLIRMKVNNIAESQHFVQHLTSNLIKSRSFAVNITHLFKQHTQVAVADESKFYDRSMVPADQHIQVISPSPVTAISPDSSQSSSEYRKKKPKQKGSPSSSRSLKSFKSICQKCDSTGIITMTKTSIDIIREPKERKQSSL